jgi:hypothetical protein
LGLTHELAHVGKLLAIFGLGAVELWAAFPVAIGLRVRPVVAGLVAGAGSMTAVLVIVTIGGPIREWLLRRFGWGASGNEKSERVERLWHRYGEVGVGLLAPLLVGIPVGAAVCVALGINKAKIILYTGVVTAFWCVSLTVAMAFGWSHIPWPHIPWPHLSI